MLVLFLVGVAAMLLASEVLTRGLERIGARLGFSEGLLGLVTALGADAPEISSACSAILARHDELGLGVVLGSNVFNLAGLLGLSAVVAGRVQVGREGVLWNGGTGLAVSGVVALFVFGWIPPWLCCALVALIFFPYALLLAMPAARTERLPLPRAARRFLVTAVGHAHRSARRRGARAGGRWDLAIVLASLAVVVVASVAAVRSATTLAARWQLPQAVMGALVLACLSSLPNVVAAVQLAREGRGEAVLSETLNSNTLNLLAGICAPALLLGLGPISGSTRPSTLWLLAMSVVALFAASRRQGLHRLGGAALIALYAAFVAVLV